MSYLVEEFQDRFVDFWFDSSIMIGSTCNLVDNCFLCDPVPLSARPDRWESAMMVQ